MSDPHASSTGQRTSNLAANFQEALTAILRVRAQPAMLQHPDTFRTQMRQLLQTAMAEARTLGYSSQHIQMAVLAVVAFLDETVLNLRTEAVGEWSRRPLQEELFGGHTAGETVFANLQALLQQQDAPEIADVLEVHCLCLELGYKGRYAFSSGGELRQIISMCRDKITRIRGRQPLFPAPALSTPQQRVSKDRIGTSLLVAAAVLAVTTVAAFGSYEFSLSSGVSRLQSNSTVLR